MDMSYFQDPPHRRHPSASQTEVGFNLPHRILKSNALDDEEMEQQTFKSFQFNSIENLSQLNLKREMNSGI